VRLILRPSTGRGARSTLRAAGRFYANSPLSCNRRAGSCVLKAR
jgi:hypothetical protein